MMLTITTIIMKTMLSPDLDEKIQLIPQKWDILDVLFGCDALVLARLSHGYWLTGCPEDWKVHNHSCYYWTAERSSNLNDAQDKCKNMSAKLPIVKSDSLNNFIRTVGRLWVWLGMKRKNGKMVWFDNTPAEPSDGALYSKWKNGEPSNNGNEDCAFLNIGTGEWNDEKCDHGGKPGPYVLCQK